ncbi:4-methylaminobutanoate oxidase (formaldehyde-forming) [archaeon HR01]|nr:4-methylaminobutanoate oxidase (formaldehyde-forming) [archaeon HR01]
MKFDIAIIGGGSTGTSIAYHLQRKGAGKVALLEKDHVGWGQTGRSTAIVRLHYSTEEVTRMALHSWRELSRMEEVVGGPSGFRPCGFILAVGEEDLGGLRKNVEIQRSVGVETRLITVDELKEIIPQVDVGGLVAAAYEPYSGYADPVLTAQTYARAAENLGCTIMVKTPVQGLRLSNGRIAYLETGKDRIEADIVVNATGVWSNDILSGTGEKLPLKVMKEEIVVWSRPESFTGEHVVFSDLIQNFYMRPYGEGQTYMGSINPDMSRVADSPKDFNLSEKVGLDTVANYGAALSRRFPSMVEAVYSGGWVGLYDVTPDWHPIIDFSEKIENLVHVVGLSGHGFKLAPAFGDIVSDLILKGRCQLVDRDFFSLRRFREGRLIGSSYKYGVIS